MPNIYNTINWGLLGDNKGGVEGGPMRMFNVYFMTMLHGGGPDTLDFFGVYHQGPYRDRFYYTEEREVKQLMYNWYHTYEFFEPLSQRFPNLRWVDLVYEDAPYSELREELLSGRWDFLIQRWYANQLVLALDKTYKGDERNINISVDVLVGAGQHMYGAIVNQYYTPPGESQGLTSLKSLFNPDDPYSGPINTGGG